MARIAIFGAGYVGLVTGACFADLGHEVVVRDVLPERIERLRAGQVPIYEPGLDEVLERARDRISFTLDEREAVSGADVLYVAVGTPPTYSGDADLSAVWTVVDEIPEDVPGRPLLVMKSTVPVGTGERVRARLDARGLDNVGYVSNPEFTAEGSAVADFMHPDRIVVGGFDPADAERVAELHAGIEGEVLRMDVASAELVKLAANAFLSTRISFINEIANVCELVGADVVEVARGVGLDHRLGPHFLQAGIGFGGSCLAGDETVLVRVGGRTRLVTLATLYDEVAPGDELEVLSWRSEGGGAEFLPVDVVTRRRYRGDVLEVRTKMGRRVTVTPDHPFVTREGRKLAQELTNADWLPVAQGLDAQVRSRAQTMNVVGEYEGVEDLIVLPHASELIGVQSGSLSPRRGDDIRRRGVLRMHEATVLDVEIEDSLVGLIANGAYVPTSITADAAFWRIAGLYVAEGHLSRVRDGRRLFWSFHPSDEDQLVTQVASYWRSRGVKARISLHATTKNVIVSSRVLAAWWTDVLGLGTNCYTQRVPDMLWDEPEGHKRAFLAGAWLGDGSWSYVNHGPSVVLEYGTASRMLADGVLRLLGDLGIVARLKVGRTAKSTCDNYWLVVSGADQVERLLELVKAPEDIEASIARQQRRIRPTGYKRGDNAAWVRVTSIEHRHHDGYVYSMEVEPSHTFVTTHGLVVSNCFPKDVTALKQLAGNAGYPFLLLQAVWEVNELQKRRVVQKLQQRLGSLRGRTVALLGLAFKPNTDDMREAPSRIIAYRLLAEGAEVKAWDPVARPTDLPGVEICDSVLDAVRDADAAVLVTEWPELRDLVTVEVREAMARPLIVDGRNLLDPAAAAAAGFEYEGIGRPLRATPGGVNGEPEPSRDRELKP